MNIPILIYKHEKWNDYNSWKIIVKLLYIINKPKWSSTISKYLTFLVLLIYPETFSFHPLNNKLSTLRSITLSKKSISKLMSLRSFLLRHHIRSRIWLYRPMALSSSPLIRQVTLLFSISKATLLSLSLTSKLLSSRHSLVPTDNSLL